MTISAKQVRYIKLGVKGRWEALCIGDGTLRVAFPMISHEAALAGDRKTMRADAVGAGLRPQTASNLARELLDFYHLGRDTVWITFADGFLWWAFADDKVEYLGVDEECRHLEEGVRLRRTVDGWHNTDANGAPLRMVDLNGDLTKVTGYRGTICNVALDEYVLAAINGEEVAELVEARSVRTQIISSIVAMMRLLNWRDFETLVELVFAASGWRRLASTGGTQKTVDLELQLPTTGERAFVQVKSKTSQRQLEDYVGRLQARDEGRMFYVYHTATGPLSAENNRVTLLGPGEFAELVHTAGLYDWLMQKAR